MHHVVACHDDFFLFALFAPLGQNGIEFFLGLLLLVAKRSGFFKILCLNRSFFFETDGFDLLLDVLYVWWPRHRVDTSARTCLVHNIDGFVGKKPAGDVTIGKSDGSLECFVGEPGFVVRLVLRAQTFQDLNGFINGRRIDLYRLKPAF